MKNPCKTCITRPACKVLCNDFRDYGEFVHDVLYVIYISTVISSLIIIFAVLYSIFPNLYIHGVLTTVLLIGYFHSCKTIIENVDDDFRNFKRWQQAGLWIFGPFLLFTSYTWDKIPALDAPIENFIYKYRKHLQPKR